MAASAVPTEVHSDSRATDGAPAAQRVLPALPPSGRARRQALDRCDPARAAGRPAALLRDPAAVPELSDRLLSERLKELEGEGIVERRVLDGPPVRVEYALTEKGHGARAAGRGLEGLGAAAGCD